ncbi:MAG: hypothetical protein NUV34_05150, partial [Sulfuricaulis sp.]|nr:hypothetical protein [Sulfuricaulis sp.]
QDFCKGAFKEDGFESPLLDLKKLIWGRLETIHQRYKTCNSQVRAKPSKHGSEVYNNLQFYETYMSSGLPLTAPAMRN